MRLCRGCNKALLSAAICITLATVSPLVAQTGGSITDRSITGGTDNAPSGAGAETGPVSGLASGLTVTHHDMIDESPTYRMRYVAPGLADSAVEYQDVAADMEVLCATHALPYLRQAGHAPDRIVIAWMSAPVAFGVMTPEIRQFFESFAVQGDLCIWEAF